MHSDLDSISISEVERRVDLIYHSIIGTYLSSNNKQFVSFYQILNRALVLVQSPACIALYKEDINGSKKSYVYSDFDFISDGVNRNHYINALKEIHGKNRVDGRYRIKQNGVNSKKLYNLFGTEYYFLLFSIERRQDNDNLIPVFKNIPNKNYLKYQEITNIEDYIGFCFKKLFQKEGVSKVFKSAVLNSLQTLTSKKIDKIIPENKFILKSEEEEINNLDNLFFSSLIKENEGILDSIYSKINHVPNNILRSIINDTSYYELPNIFFFTRFYSRKKERFKTEDFEGYSYNIRMVIPESQQKSILSYLIEIQKRGKEETLRRSNSSYHGLDKGNQLIESIDNYFWCLLNDSPQKILDILMSNVGDNARSFTDSVFSSGTIHFREPFKIAGIDRIIKSDCKTFDDIPEQDIKDFIRIVSFYYIIDAMAPWVSDSGECNKYLILYPIEVSGKIMSIVGQAINMTKNEFLDRNSWEAIYYFYHYVFLRVEIGYRSKIKQSYLKEISNNLKGLLLKTILHGGLKSTKYEDIEKVIVDINKYVSYFSRFHSYNNISISIKESDITSDITLFGEHDLLIKLKDNNYFPSIRNSKELGNLITKFNTNSVITKCISDIDLDLSNMYQFVKKDINGII